MVPRYSYHFVGYCLRANVSGCNYVLLKSGEWKESDLYNAKIDGGRAIYQPGDNIPVVELNYVTALVIVVLYEKDNETK